MHINSVERIHVAHPSSSISLSPISFPSLPFVLPSYFVPPSMDIDVDGEYPILQYATADMLAEHENEAYLESQGKILGQQEEISKLTIKHQYLQYVPVCAQKGKSSPLDYRELYDKVLGWLQWSGSSHVGQSSACETTASSSYPPLHSNHTTLPQLNHSEYPQVKYWTQQQWDNHCAGNKGKTNGLAQTIGKHGQPAKTVIGDELNDNSGNSAKHPILKLLRGDLFLLSIFTR